VKKIGPRSLRIPVVDVGGTHVKLLAPHLHTSLGHRDFLRLVRRLKRASSTSLKIVWRFSATIFSHAILPSMGK